MTAHKSQTGSRMITSQLKLDGLIVRRGATPLFSVTCSIDGGTVTTIMGPSGIGKSTLIAAIAGFLPPAFSLQGAITLNDQDLLARPAHRRCVGVMFQDPLLFPHLSVGQNVAFALPSTIKGAERDQKVKDLLSSVGLSGYEARDPATLSGGQSARVALVRTLAAEPKALLLDEPFSKLDAQLRSQVRGLVFSHARELGLPTLLVTHDQTDAEAAGGPVIDLAAANS